MKLYSRSLEISVKCRQARVQPHSGHPNKASLLASWHVYAITVSMPHPHRLRRRLLMSSPTFGYVPALAVVPSFMQSGRSFATSADSLAGVR